MALQAPPPQHETNGHDAPPHAFPARFDQQDVREYLQGALRFALGTSSEELASDRQFSPEENVLTFSNFLTSTRPAFYVQKIRVKAKSPGQFCMRMCQTTIS